MNLIDAIINYFDPKRGYERARFRDASRSYTAARTDRFGSWFPRNGPPEATDAPYRNLIRARARDLERNNGIIEGAIGIIVRNVTGLGIKPQALVLDEAFKQQSQINDAIEAEWGRWIRKNNCDINKRDSFYAIQSLFLRRMLVDGEVFLLPVTDSKGFRLQLLEPDLLAEDITKHGTNNVFGGVEVDSYMTPVAYHFRPDAYDRKVVRINASRIIHSFNRRRAQQVRGISIFAVSMEDVRDCGEFIGSELKAARIAAAHTGIVESQTGAAAIGRSGRVSKDAANRNIQEIEIGVLNYLQSGDKVTFPTPGRPNGAAAPFVSAIMRLISISLGLSYEALSRDLSQVNYSSAREGRLQDIKLYEIVQEKLIEDLCQPVYEAWLDYMVLSERLKLPGYWKDRERYQKCRWVTPGWKWVDPAKEAIAAEKRLNMNLTTLAELCGSEGSDWQEILEQRAAEKAYEAELGMGEGSATKQ